MKWLVAILAAVVILDHINLYILRKDLQETREMISSLCKFSEYQIKINDFFLKFMNNWIRFAEDLANKNEEKNQDDRSTMQQM